MKKTQIILTALLAALLTGSCSSGDEPQAASEGQTPILLTSSIATTRAAQGIQNTSFDTGENIYVQIFETTADGTILNNYTPLRFAAAAGGALNPPANTFPYFPVSGNPVMLYAVYPYSWVQAGTTTFTVETNQVERSAYKRSDLMYAATAAPVAKTDITEATPSIPLTFRHLLSKVNVTLTADNDRLIEGARIKLQGVRTKVDVDKAAGTLTPIESDSENPTQEIQLATAESGLTSCAAVIVPQTVAPGKFIEIRLQNKDILNYRLLVNTEFKAGESYTYIIKVSQSGISKVSTTVEPWGTDDHPDVITGRTGIY